MLTVTAPAALNGKTLRAELAAVGIVVGEREMSLIGSALVFSALGEPQRSTVEPVVAAHTGAPDPEVANGQQLRDRAAAALDSNATFLALTSPTNAQTLAQVQLVTRECNALIRLAINHLDTTAGT